MTKQIQILNERYVDNAALLKLLKERFKKENFVINVCE